ncbi:hypothetical protein [Streptomyces sp. NPDC002537]
MGERRSGSRWGAPAGAWAHAGSQNCNIGLDLAQISPYLTEHINRFGACSTHELGITPDTYDTRLDVDFSVLEDEQAPAA